MTEKSKILTKAEEQIMQVLWKLEHAFLRDVLDALPAPRPHQNTVATILKILVEKEFAGIEIFGRTHRYFPRITKEMYSKSTIKNVVRKYFQGSFSEAVSFMVTENNLSLEDLELLVKQLKKKQKNH